MSMPLSFSSSGTAAPSGTSSAMMNNSGWTVATGRASASGSPMLSLILIAGLIIGGAVFYKALK